MNALPARITDRITTVRRTPGDHTFTVEEHGTFRFMRISARMQFIQRGAEMTPDFGQLVVIGGGEVAAIDQLLADLDKEAALDAAGRRVPDVAQAHTEAVKFHPVGHTPQDPFALIPGC